MNVLYEYLQYLLSRIFNRVLYKLCQIDFLFMKLVRKF